MTLRLRVISIACLCLGMLMLPTQLRPSSAAADGNFQIKLATIAPAGSKPGRILRTWDEQLKKKTGDRAKFVTYWGGQAGDEHDLLKKMNPKVKQIDAATFTSVGLGQVVPSATALLMPGLFKTYDDLNKVRAAMDTEWRGQFDKAGYQLLGWFDIGFGRIFSTQPIAKPSDLTKARPWVWKEDPVFPAFLHIVHANGVALGLPEVFMALNTKSVDTVIASPIAALGLKWSESLKYMTKQADFALVGATLISNASFKAMPPDIQEALVSTGKTAHQEALSVIASQEKATYDELKKTIKEVDTAPNAAEWNAAYTELRNELVAKRRLDKAVLERVIAATK